MKVPNAALWGLVVAVLNFIPYFGPFAGVVILGGVGLLAFETLWWILLPPGWYLLLHLLGRPYGSRYYYSGRYYYGGTHRHYGDSGSRSSGSGSSRGDSGRGDSGRGDSSGGRGR